MNFVVIKENSRLRTRDLLYHIKVLLCVIVMQCAFLHALFVVNYTEMSGYDSKMKCCPFYWGELIRQKLTGNMTFSRSFSDKIFL